MVCPYCHQVTKVGNSRRRRAGFSVWRRRCCHTCKISFTTTENILIESVIVFKDAQGALKPIRRSDIHISIFNALGGLKSASKDAEALTLTCLDKLLNEKQAVLPITTLEKHIFETLQAVDPLAGQRYLLNELQRTQLLKPEKRTAD